MNQHQIIIEDQGLRDGLQTLSVNVSLDDKLYFIHQLIDAGLKRIQVASFVNPKLLPQMADAEAICAQLPNNSAVVFSGLVLNIKGVERAIKAGLKHLAISISASNTHSLKNANKTISEAKAEFAQMVKMAQDAGIIVRGGIQCAFGCRYEGAISEDLVVDLAKHHIECGVPEIALADSTGMGNPLQVKNLLTKVKTVTGNTPIALHLHNTENKGYANMLAAIEIGVNQFDTAFGGLGGCPFIKGATGNIATEDVVHLLHQMGFITGINMHKVGEISKKMEQLIGEKLPGLMYQLFDKTDIKII